MSELAKMMLWIKVILKLRKSYLRIEYKTERMNGTKNSHTYRSIENIQNSGRIRSAHIVSMINHTIPQSINCNRFLSIIPSLLSLYQDKNIAAGIKRKVHKRWSGKNFHSCSYQSCCNSWKYKPSIICDVFIYTYHMMRNIHMYKKSTFEIIFLFFFSKYIRNNKKLYKLSKDTK